MKTIAHPFAASQLSPRFQPKFENVLVTPSTAVEALATVQRVGELKRSTCVRDINPNRVIRYAADMAMGNWRVTGDPIRFDMQGRLIDGQHRLEAVKRAGVSVEMAVVTEIAEDCFRSIDTGQSRSSGQILAYEGVRESNQVCAVIRWMLAYNQAISKGARITKSGGVVTTQDRIEETLRSHPGIYESVAATKRFSGERLIPSSICAFVHYKACKTSPKLTMDFFERLFTGVIEKRWCPVRVLRDWVIGHRAEHLGRVDRIWAVWMTAEAWCRFEDGGNGRQMIYSPDLPFPRFRCDEVDAKVKAA